jgi:hypothetical protein
MKLIKKVPGAIAKAVQVNPPFGSLPVSTPGTILPLRRYNA